MQTKLSLAQLLQEQHLDCMALLPCPIKVPFEKMVLDYVERVNESEENKSEEDQLHVWLKGHANHHLNFYEQIEQIKDVNQLPDIMITPGINAFFEENFKRKFVDKGYFKEVLPLKIEPQIKQLGYLDPKHRYSMLFMNELVMVIYRPNLGKKKEPQSWCDILDPAFESSIVIRGQKQVYCESVLLGFYALEGEIGVRKLAQNTTMGVHPSEMICMIQTHETKGNSVFIMPYFYAKTLEKNKDAAIIWPKEGAIINPISVLVKKDISPQGERLAKFIAGEEIANVCAGAFFPSTCKSSGNDLDKKFLWIGWEELEKGDIAKKVAWLNGFF